MDSSREDDELMIPRNLARRRQSLPANIHSSLDTRYLRKRFARLGQDLPSLESQDEDNESETETVTKLSPDIAELIQKYKRTGSAFASRRSWYNRGNDTPSDSDGFQMPNYNAQHPTRRGSIELQGQSTRNTNRRSSATNSATNNLPAMSPRLKYYPENPRTSLVGSTQDDRPGAATTEESGEEEGERRERASSLSPGSRRKPAVRVVAPGEGEGDGSDSGNSSRSNSPNPLEMARLRARRHSVDVVPGMPRGILKFTPRASPTPYKTHSIWDQTLEECSRKFGKGVKENIPDGSEVYQAALEEFKQKEGAQEKTTTQNDEHVEKTNNEINENGSPQNTAGLASPNKFIKPASASSKQRKVKFQAS